MLINIVMILAGFFLLVRGADYFVSGSASIARKLGIPGIVVGLTVIAVGTSAPELFVNMIAATQGATDLSIGNVMGSNLVNILVALGVAAIVVPLKLKKGTVWKEIPFTLLATVFVLIFVSDFMLDGTIPNVISRTDAFALLGLFVIFIVYTFGIRQAGEQHQERIEMFPWSKSLGFTLGGVAALAVGGYLTVEGAVEVATIVGISQNLIGLTIVAIGTSLPEIVTTVIAARKDHIDIAVGGVVGSNIFNVLLVLGATGMVSPIVANEAVTTDVAVVTLVTALLFAFMFFGKKHTLDRKQGIIFILLYIAYITFAIIRG
jgi:cation:H+ antiporter